MSDVEAIVAIIAKVATLPTLPILLLIWYRITRLERILPFLAEVSIAHVRDCREGCHRDIRECK